MCGDEGSQLKSYSIEYSWSKNQPFDEDFGAKMAEQQQEQQQPTILKVSVLHYRDQSHDTATFLK